MPETTVSTPTETPAAPAAATSTATPEFDWNSLEGASPEKFREAVLGSTPAPAEEVKPASPETTPAEPVPAEETLETKLAKLEEDEVKEPAKPQLDPEQQFVLSLFPNRAVVDETVHTLQSYANFTNAFRGGDFENVSQMFQEFAPEAWDSFLNHLYTKNIESWVDQWIEEKEGKSSPRIKAMESELQKLKMAHEQRTVQEQQAVTARVQAQNAEAFKGHLDKLFNAISFSAKDRRLVEADIRSRIASDQSAMQQVRTGKFGMVTRHFKEAVRDFVADDQPKAAALDAKRTAQEAKIAPIAVAPVPTQVSTSYEGLKGEKQLEASMDAQLSTLFASRKRR